MDEMKNVDAVVADGFGREWSAFDQSSLATEEHLQLFNQYFSIFPWAALPPDATGIDIGCGSGRWAMLVADKVASLHLLDASSEALSVAERNLSGKTNVIFHHASVGDIPVPDSSLDFAYSLGVLHHVPDTQAAISSIARKLKPGAPFLVYLYYALDNRPLWFRVIWRCSNVLRVVISNSPSPVKMAVSQIIAALVYWPLARFAFALHRLGLSTASVPLEAYKERSFYTMRTDSYDRFCTSLEKRFTKEQIASMLNAAGFKRIAFSSSVPFWCAVGFNELGSPPR